MQRRENLTKALNEDYCPLPEYDSVDLEVYVILDAETIMY